MQPTDVDAGVTLGGRYRIGELLAQAPVDGRVARTWLATDEVLSRPVVVHLLDADDPRTPDLLDAARRAAAVSDVRFLRVLDALTEDNVAYVVKEWSPGHTLGELVESGPISPTSAGWLVREVAEALVGAHAEGLAHQCLEPDSVLVTDMGAVRVIGLATDHVLFADGRGGAPGDDAERARDDALGLGGLLYAGLTGRWPGARPGQDALRPAPRNPDGSVLSPRQCRAGVPRPLDEITQRILTASPRQGVALRTPQEVAAALTDTVGVMPHEALAGLAGESGPEETALIGGGHGNGYGHADAETTRIGLVAGAEAPTAAHDTTGVIPGGAPDGTVNLAAGSHQAGANGSALARDTATARVDTEAGSATAARDTAVRSGPGVDEDVPARVLPPPPPGRYRPPRSSRPRWGRIVGVLLVMLLLVAAGFVGWRLSQRALGAGSPEASPSPQHATPEPTPTGPQPGTVYPISAAGDFDPPPGNGEEHADEVGNAIDGDAGTSWRTMEYYGDPRLGNLKPGVGLTLDLGRVRTVGSVKLDLFGDGTDLQLRAAPAKASSTPDQLDGWKQVTSVSGAGSKATLRLDKPVRTRYLMVWLTKLPSDGDQFRGGVSEVVVRR